MGPSTMLQNNLIATIGYLSIENFKSYCFPSQNKLVEINRRLYQQSRCRRSVNYALRYIEDESYLRRKRRVRRGKDGKPVFRSTLYFLSGKGWRYVYKRASLYPAHIIERLRAMREKKDMEKRARASYSTQGCVESRGMYEHKSLDCASIEKRGYNKVDRDKWRDLGQMIKGV